jgi:hypothetical protein
MISRMSTPLRLLITAVVLAAVFFITATVMIPTRLSFGAGSLGCGTALDADGWDQESVQACSEAGRQRLRDASVAAGIIAAVALLPLALHRLVNKYRAARVLLTGVLVVYWLLTVPLMLYWMTAAY